MFSRTLLVIVCLHLCKLGAGIGQAETCKPVKCWNCSQPLGRNTTQACPLCQSSSLNCTNDVLQNCTIKDLNVTIYTSSTKVQEGTTVTLNCTHDDPAGSIGWLKDNKLEKENEETYQIKHILKTSVIICKVDSICGNYNSTITIVVEAANNLLVLLICVGAAAALLMLFAIVMKIALKRGQAQSQARKRQRQQNMENIHSTVNTVSSYY